MGIASWALGADNPFSQYVADNRQTIKGAFAGFGQGTNFGAGLGNAAMGAQRGALLDDVTRADTEAEKQRVAQINQTAAFLREKGAEDLAAAVEGGMTTGADAFNQWYSAQNQQAETIKPTSSIQEYEYALGQGYQGTFQEYETAMKQAGATSIDFNQNQGTAAAYADRMAAANSIIDDPSITAAQTDLTQKGLGGVPVIGNMLTSEDRKLAEQAQRDFVNAILRRESGAVISDSEFANAAQQYFPQPGDTPAVIEQKKRNREMAIQGVSRAAGPAYQPPSLTPAGVVPYTDFFR